MSAGPPPEDESITVTYGWPSMGPPWVRRWRLERALMDNARLRRDLAIAEDALEAERQWRLTSLPALLAAEARALQAEARCAELEAAVTRELTTQFPELRPHAALINAYHETTAEERP